MVGTNKNLVLTAEAAAQLHEGINLVLSRWTALRIAVNECRSRDSAQKPQQLAQILFQALIQSKEKVYTDDLENMLYDFLVSLKTVADDGSIEEVAEKLVFMHEECAEGNFNSIKSLKETNAPSVYYVRQDRSDDEDDSDDDGHDGDISTEMRVDAPDSSLSEEDMMIDETSPEEVAEVEAGWTVVASKRNKAGRRN
ncbi:pre-rRNA-processing protein TSR2 homolog [Olea europaea var. sylvestris]|uniref:pre-rRNA-processing protein TSR2 homolog n=1 Tax=Olea europaea var. sylvestris TaxID=158386 RepID=UPI000C1D8951|nr:pre-rRNA-processing protein TSR2 homolog [Olea europaea var. sylvestris]